MVGFLLNGSFCLRAAC
ncbi:hypothetical protein F383_36615 [Gossypium arboreum]|uniref:Uncharacterized protein n=1 Tax=Gossypium arboreum TaxID=29729 RepID=A0A0B0M9V0_GOSAR|nr:hypothetical protein F383_36615 [Gossypium arboreum]